MYNPLELKGTKGLGPSQLKDTKIVGWKSCTYNNGLNVSKKWG
jgi:hypothetical protein